MDARTPQNTRTALPQQARQARPLLLASSLSLLALTLAGCAGSPMRSYDDELKETVTLIKTGALPQALESIERNNTSMFASKPDEKKGESATKGTEKAKEESASGGDKDLLYYLEKGQVQNLQNQYAPARDTWLKGDATVQEWEESFKADPSKLFGDIGSYLVSDRVRRYDGQDYEKVFLSTKLTLNHLLLGNFDHARIEMKKTYEREKLIERFREMEYDKLKEDGESKGVKPDLKQLGSAGYPMAELDTPEVNSLKNGFQNAFAHYLAGYFFEVTGEPSLAEPGYRNALALRPDSKLIKEGLSRVGKRKPGARESDVLFVIESGFAPSWKSVTIPIPIPTGRTIIATPLSFPIIKSEHKGYVPPSLAAAGKTLPVETLANVDTMSRRLLKDQLPGIILRTTIRAIAKSVAQTQAEKHGGILAGALVTVASVVTEQADERAWRTLPEQLAVARGTLPYGKHTLEFQTGKGTFKTEVNIGSRFTVVPIRLTGGAVFVGEQNQLPSSAQALPEPEQTSAGDAPAAAAAPAKNTNGSKGSKGNKAPASATKKKAP